MIKPKMLNKGDTIAVIAPSSGLGGVFPHRLDNGIKALKDLGFRVKEFPTARSKYNGDSGTPEQRAKDVMDAFLDEEVKAILCTIGGLSCNALLRLLDYESISQHPKIFCGYSDITVLHYALGSRSKLVTFYGPAVLTQFGEFPKPLDYSVQYFFKALCSIEPVGRVLPSEKWTEESLDWSKKLDLTRARKLQDNEGYVWLKEGKVSAPIVGGCLHPMSRTRGTVFDADYRKKILLIETSEGEDFSKGSPLGKVDSYLQDLVNVGVFDKIKGLVFGRPYGYTTEQREQMKQIVLKHTQPYKFPVLYNLDIGHTDPIITIPLNAQVSLDSKKNLFSIDESGVE